MMSTISCAGVYGAMCCLNFIVPARMAVFGLSSDLYSMEAPAQYLGAYALQRMFSLSTTLWTRTLFIGSSTSSKYV